MAKQRHEQEQAPAEQGNGAMPFALAEGAFGVVPSHVGTLNIVSADGTVVKLAKSDLQVKRTKRLRNKATGEEKVEEYDDWRFQAARTLPMPRTASTRDELIASLVEFMDNLTAFDAASEYVMPNGAVKRKAYTCLTDGSKEAKAVSAEQYLLDLVVEAHTLRNQKVMQTRLREMAEATIRKERGIEEPSKKVRVRKVSDQYEEVDDGADAVEA